MPRKKSTSKAQHDFLKKHGFTKVTQGKPRNYKRKTGLRQAKLLRGIENKTMKMRQETREKITRQDRRANRLERYDAAISRRLSKLAHRKGLNVEEIQKNIEKLSARSKWSLEKRKTARKNRNELAQRNERIDKKEQRLTRALKRNLAEYALMDLKLFKRQAFIDILKKKFRNKKDHTLVFMDLDNFKQVNTISHEQGNKILDHFSRAIRRSFPGSEIESIYNDRDLKSVASRYGGEEFVIYTHYPIDMVIKKLRTIAKSFTYRVRHDSKNIATKLRHSPPTFSAGVYQQTKHGIEFERMINEADKLKMKAKTSADKNTVYYKKFGWKKPLSKKIIKK